MCVGVGEDTGDSNIFFLIIYHDLDRDRDRGCDIPAATNTNMDMDTLYNENTASNIPKPPPQKKDND